MAVRHAPVLFGTAKEQLTLKRILQEGKVPAPPDRPKRLISAGLVATIGKPYREFLILNPNHPAYNELRRTLSDLYVVTPARGFAAKKPTKIHPSRPLAHQGFMPFQIICELVKAGAPITIRDLEQRIPDAWPTSIGLNVERLRKDGVLLVREKSVLLAPSVPSSFARFVLKTARALKGASDAPSMGTERVSAFARPRDAAPLLFGTDIRLRTLMALAKYGAMNVSDLRRVLGGSTIRPESDNHAMFTRAGVVFEWRTEDGRCAALDPRFPAIRELKALLTAIEKRHSLRKIERRYAVPKLPRLSRRWDGDHRSLLGGPIATAVLLTIAANGWSFEALCVAYAVGYDRVVTKKVVKRLEEQGLIAGDRRRRPGFNVRVLRLQPEFFAHAALERLLKAYVRHWPAIGAEVRSCLDRLPARTKAHLRRRGLLSQSHCNVGPLGTV